MCIYLLNHCLHKVQPLRLTGGFLEGEGIITCLYFGRKSVSEVGNIVWRGLVYFVMVDKLGRKTLCLWNNGLVVRNGHRYKEVNEAKYLGYAIYLL